MKPIRCGFASFVVGLGLTLVLVPGCEAGDPGLDASVLRDASLTDVGGREDSGPSPMDAMTDSGLPMMDGACAPCDGGVAPDALVGTPRSWVDPFVGTGASGLNFGALFPGPKRPFGMVSLSPDTHGLLPASFGVGHAGGYYYDDTLVRGFSHMHLAGTGLADYGNFSVVPAVGSPALLLVDGNPPDLVLDHEREFAEPGYYRLVTDEVTSELTATARVGLHRYTFMPSVESVIFLDVTHTLGMGLASDSAVTVDPVTGEMFGFVHNVGDFSKRFDGFDLFFVAVPNRAPDTVGTWDPDGYADGRLAVDGTQTGVALGYDTTDDPVIELKIGISFVDVAGARANLDAEVGARTFDAVHAESGEVWDDALGVITVEGGTLTRRKLFYTALYHTQLMPNLASDVDGRYRGLDLEIHIAEGFDYYTDFSLWDTYRTLHPLASLLWPDRQRDFLQSLARMGAQWEVMPTWPLATGETGSMVGTSGDVVFGDALGKIDGTVDWTAAYAAMRAGATAPGPPGKPARDQYAAWEAHGYVPVEAGTGSVSKTLEYAHDDYCLARLAEHLGHEEDAALFAERAGWWRNLWDDTHGFFGPRRGDGTFAPYDPQANEDVYIEGSSWQYLFAVPHDVPGLVALMGADRFEAKLRTLMERGRTEFTWALPSPYYYHGNEPDILFPWLFGFVDRPDLTRFWTTWVADTAYALEPWGLAGNDDGGTLSAWYVFAALGIYPMTCTGQYALSSPLFERISVQHPAGHLEVRRSDDPMGTPTINGVAHAAPTIAHADLMSDSVLTLPPPPADSDGLLPPEP